MKTAPRRIKQLMEQKAFRNKITIFLSKFRAENPLVIKKEIQIYADEDEVEEMALCH